MDRKGKANEPRGVRLFGLHSVRLCPSFLYHHATLTLEFSSWISRNNLPKQSANFCFSQGKESLQFDISCQQTNDR
jgi:hypothetical protein